jgi:hypothetical protein
MVVAKCCTRAVEEVAGKPLTTAKWIGGMLVVTLGVYGLGWFFFDSMNLVLVVSGPVLMKVFSLTARELGLGKVGAISFATVAGVGHLVIVKALCYKSVLEIFVSAVTG